MRARELHPLPRDLMPRIEVELRARVERQDAALRTILGLACDEDTRRACGWREDRAFARIVATAANAMGGGT